MALLAHILGIFTSFVVPLIIWLIKKDDDEFIANREERSHITVIVAYFAITIIGIVI